MAKFDQARMETLVRDVLNASSAPPHSALWASAPERLQPLLTDGDSQDGWVFASTMMRIIVEHMGLRDTLCPHPEHHGKYVGGFAPYGKNGQPDPEQVYVGPPEDAPLDMQLNHYDTLMASEMMNAEILNDSERSQRA